MEKIGIYDARARLSELVERVEAGEEVVLTRHGRAVVRLVAATASERKPQIAAVERIKALRKALDIRGVDIGALIREGRR
jgi:prevent-host-death family protein